MTDYIDIDESEAKQLLADMPWNAEDKKKPLFSQIMVGYMIAKAVYYFTFFIKKALNCIDTAIIDMNQDEVWTDNVEAYKAREMLYQSLSEVNRLAEGAHVLLAELNMQKGYGKITTAMFKHLKIGVVIR